MKEKLLSLFKTEKVKAPENLLLKEGNGENIYCCKRRCCACCSREEREKSGTSVFEYIVVSVLLVVVITLGIKVLLMDTNSYSIPRGYIHSSLNHVQSDDINV